MRHTDSGNAVTRVGQLHMLIMFQQPDSVVEVLVPAQEGILIVCLIAQHVKMGEKAFDISGNRSTKDLVRDFSQSQEISFFSLVTWRKALCSPRSLKPL